MEIGLQVDLMVVRVYSCTRVYAYVRACQQSQSGGYLWKEGGGGGRGHRKTQTYRQTKQNRFSHIDCLKKKKVNYRVRSRRELTTAANTR